MNVGQLLPVAWRVARFVPEPVLRGAAALGADLVWWRRGGGVRQLERNLARARPDLPATAVRRLSREGMRSYLRYYAEAFTLASFTPAQTDARVRALGVEGLRTELDAGRAVVLALGHMGNWDLAGAWATRAIAPVTTVAEKLEPEAAFREFLAFREGIGLEIIPLDGSGGEVFRRLVRAVRAGPRLVPLLADRDLTARGVEVQLFGQTARVAAGPAALALSTGARLSPVTIRYERLTGARRRAAGSPWGVVVTFHPALPVPRDLPRAEQVAALTQGWVDVVAAGIAEHPQDWHMLQKVFVADLDPARYAATVADAGPADAGAAGAAGPADAGAAR
ncbi:phosphatidylinositol mannoside acyltransferase [Cellulomonas aerilata]|uniref:Lipid A biosynthesis lauroyl acyltransferase n=1 Tax=Cellulomonas aerilata TaxID=515326 RepID=A0A512DA73_9CELL|nr:phosphatidylinositol mannoside acyltransferase [Cellulomonas aerilata]GEO33355.1 lipid A biosynthesis lauroyl acyltransferase [Cellulomonas aerilata]